MSKAASKAFDPAKYVRKNLNADTVGKLKEVFDVFDYDGSGNVSTEELINTIRALNMESQAGQILAIVNNSGHVGDIDFSAFLDIFGFGGDSTSEGTLQSIFEDFDISKTGAFGPKSSRRWLPASASTSRALRSTRSSSTRTRTETESSASRSSCTSSPQSTPKYDPSPFILIQQSYYHPSPSLH